MTNIVGLKTRPAETNEQTIRILKDYLEMAERGEIVAVAIAGLEPSGASITTASASEQQQALIGAVAILQHRILMNREGA